ncbi:MAG: hypothetical protein HC904_00735 [Blastochloris sp.]|nr:hypothetical protein [Blastochloris sp.]
MRHSAWILAYHGCDRSIGDQILRGDSEVKPSNNEYDWLGKGSYFWENSYSRALKWAQFLKEHPSYTHKAIKDPFVVGAIIDPGNCLDLTEAECLDILKEAYAQYVDVMRLVAKYSGEPTVLPKNEPGFKGDEDLVKRKLDCAVINWLHKTREDRKLKSKGLQPFDTVRGAFSEGDSLFENSKIESRTHIQWSVLDPARSVVAYFRPRIRN